LKVAEKPALVLGSLERRLTSTPFTTTNPTPPETGDPMNALAEPVQASADEMPAPLIFTDSAAAKVADLVAEEGNPELKLRVFVQGGGCSGFQYGFTFDEVVNEDDTQMSKNGVTLLIDAMSLQYLVGAEIDYKEDLQGAQFVIKNPNATTTCGCGSVLGLRR
jgi:iron-sulfur cluster insertion protein